MTSIPTPQETIEKLQADALEAVRSYQAATIKTVEAWTEAFAKVSGNTPAVPELPAELKAAFGDPAAMIDSSYAFATQVLDLNKKFAHELIDAQKASATTASATGSKASGEATS